MITLQSLLTDMALEIRGLRDRVKRLEETKPMEDESWMPVPEGKLDKLLTEMNGEIGDLKKAVNAMFESIQGLAKHCENIYQRLDRLEQAQKKTETEQ